MSKVARRRTRPPAAERGPASPPALTLPVVLVAAALLALTWAAFAGALGHSFVDWDDFQYVTENPHVLGRHYGELLRTVVVGGYAPLTMVSFAWNVSQPLRAAPFIATNVALHLLNTLMVFVLVLGLSRRRLLVAAFVALLFGIHPMHVESVAWVTERKDVLYAFFLLAGLLAYQRHLARPRGGGWLAAAFGLFVLSCLSKGMAVVFPALLVMLDWWNGRRVLERRAMLEKLPFVAVSLLFGVVAVVVQKGGDLFGLLHRTAADAGAAPPTGLGPLLRAIVPTYGYLTYAWRLLVPSGLCAYYPHPTPAEAMRPQVLLSPLFFLATVALVLWDLRRTRVIAFGLGWFLVTMVPVLQWIPVSGSLVPDRFSYVSYLGPLFALGMGLQAAFERRRAVGLALWCAGGVWAALLFVQATRQVEVWRDGASLWDRTIRQYPRLANPYLYRGKLRALAGQTREAQDDFRTALELGLRTADVYEGLGTTYGRLGRLDSALVVFDRALALEPRRGMLYYNRGVTWLHLGRAREALEDLDRAMALAPEQAAMLYGPRGYARARVGQYRAAVDDFDRAIAAGAGDAAILGGRAYCRLQLGDREGAVADFREALRLDPANADARAGLRALGDPALR